MLEVRLRGSRCASRTWTRSIEFYGGKLGLRVEIDKAPQLQ